MSLNSVNIIGNLTRDPELRYTNSGKAVCTLSIANNRVYSSNNEKVTEVSYFDVEVWGLLAENCSKYLSKGRGIVVEGRLKQERWEKEGKTQSKVKISANNIHFLPRRDGGEGGGASGDSGQKGSGYQASAPRVAAPAVSTGAKGSDDTVAWDE